MFYPISVEVNSKNGVQRIIVFHFFFQFFLLNFEIVSLLKIIFSTKNLHVLKTKINAIIGDAKIFAYKLYMSNAS